MADTQTRRTPHESEEEVFPRTVLIVDPADSSRQKGAAVLDALGFVPRTASDAFEAHALIDGTVAVIAVHPSAEAIYPRLRDSGIPLVASLPSKLEEPENLAQEIGADAYVMRPYKRETVSLALYAALNARLLRDRAVRAEAALINITSPRRDRERSGLLHVDLFRTLLPLEIRRARRHGYPIAICVVSLDPPTATRAVTEELARAAEPFLRAAVRDVDLAVRYGDGRFLVFLPHTDATGAGVVGRRIAAEIRNCRFKTGGAEVMVTASVGIATPRSGKGPSFARLIKDAHAAVRAAQLKGGDRVIVR